MFLFVAGDECINGWLDPICLANIGDQMGAEMESVVESSEGVVAGSVVEISGIGDWVAILFEEPGVETDLTHVGLVMFCVWV